MPTSIESKCCKQLTIFVCDKSAFDNLTLCQSHLSNSVVIVKEMALKLALSSLLLIGRQHYYFHVLNFFVSMNPAFSFIYSNFIPTCKKYHKKFFCKNVNRKTKIKTYKKLFMIFILWFLFSDGSFSRKMFYYKGFSTTNQNLNVTSPHIFNINVIISVRFAVSFPRFSVIFIECRNF